MSARADQATAALWISGPPGVGKSTAGWGLFERLRAAGRPAAYVDVDQLGLIYPDPPDDPEGRRLQAVNVRAVLSNFAAAGAAPLVVSGVVDPVRGLDPLLRTGSELAVTLVRLHARWPQLRDRYVRRGLGIERLDELAALATALDRLEADVALDVTAATPDEVVDRLAGLVTPASGLPRGGPAPPRPVEGPPRPILLITGPTAVGKSTVGWSVFGSLGRRGLRASYLDIDQLGFAAIEGTHRLKSLNAASVWRGHRDAGAERLVAVARAAPGVYRAAFAGEHVLQVHLDAPPRDLAQRTGERARGGGPNLAGNDIVGADPAEQERIAARAAAEAVEFRRRATSQHLVIDTGDQGSATVSERVLEAWDAAVRGDAAGSFSACHPAASPHGVGRARRGDRH